MENQKIKTDSFFTRELFVETLRVLDKQKQHDEKATRTLSKVFNCNMENYDNHLLNNQLVKLLQTEFPAECGCCDIEFFMWEIDFGRRYYPGCVKENGGNVDFSDAGKLYDYLITK